MLTKLKAIFGRLGLNEKETGFYLAVLELGQTTIAEVSKKTSIPRATCYLLLESLKQRGLVIESPIGRKRTILALEPNNLHGLFEREQKSLTQAKERLGALLPELLLISNHPAGKPRVRFYEGREGVKTIYEETLDYREVLVHCTTQKAILCMGDYLDHYLKRLIKKRIKTKEIVSDTPLDLNYQEKYATRRNVIKTIPREYVTNTDSMIYGDKVAFISYREERPIGIVIEDKEITDLERKKFAILWRAIESELL